MANLWLSTYRRAIENVDRDLTEAMFRNEHTDLPLSTIMQLFRGAIAEINKQDVKILELRNELEELKSKESAEQSVENENKKD